MTYITASTRQRIYAFIQRFIRKKGYSPSIREIGQHVGLGSTSTVYYHLTILAREGSIRWERGLVRTIRLAGKDEPESASFPELEEVWA